MMTSVFGHIPACQHVLVHPFGHFLPIDQFPAFVYELSSSVAVVDVIRMFPYVDG